MPHSAVSVIDRYHETSGRSAGSRQTILESKPSRKPRICIPTARNFTRRFFQCGFYEAQDVLREIDDVELIVLEPGRQFAFREKWQRRLLFRDFSKKLVFANPGLHKFRLTGEYDLFVAHCQTWWDLLYINAIEGWKEHCKTSVCWIDELWASAIPKYKYLLHALNRFDHVFVGYSGTVAPLSRAIGKTCHWLPGGVDTLRFSPFPKPPSRVVDVYSIGRRWEKIHRTLLAAAERRELFYVYDTFPTVFTEVYDHREHRESYANAAKRSRYFMVAPGKMDLLEETQGQVAIGYRYYEGAAAGAVMIGEAPNCEEFRTMFPWQNAVVQIRPDGSDVLDVLADLSAKPGLCSAMSHRNAAGALLCHDWLYRWKQIFKVADLDPLPGMIEREQRLKIMAALALTNA
jgi:hypothetical protein